MAETPPPGVSLTLTAAENPFNLQPLNTPLGTEGTVPLWPLERGFKRYGYNRNGSNPRNNAVDTAHLTKQLGGTIVRTGIAMHVVRATETGPWDYTVPDADYRALILKGVRPLFNLWGCPARFRDTTYPVQNDWTPWKAGTNNATHQILSSIAKDAATRYPLAAGFTFGNEPNHPNNWGGSVNAASYATHAYWINLGIKLAKPNIPVLMGEMAAWGEPPPANCVALRPYLKTLLQNGIQDRCDGISYHPYLMSPYNAANDPANIAFRAGEADRFIQQAYTELALAVKVRFVHTETGCSTSDGYPENRQANWEQWWLDRICVADANYFVYAAKTDAVLYQEPIENPDAPAQYQKGFGHVRPKSGGTFPTKQVFRDLRAVFGGIADYPVSI